MPQSSSTSRTCPDKWLVRITEYNGYPRRSSLTRSPDTLSPLWPDRPIRPMPRNRLSSRLSPEQADSIVYPPQPPSSSPLFSFPYGLTDPTERRRGHGSRHTGHAHCTCGADHDESEEEEGAYDHPSYRWSSPAAAAAAAAAADGARLDNVQRKLIDASRGPLKPPPPPASTASSADGYESFENTSNKKKRKIPLSSGSSVHQSQLSAEMANMGISSSTGLDGVAEQAVGENNHYSHGAAIVSGPSRVRYGRQNNRSDRRPLGATSHSLPNGYNSSLSASSRGGNWKGDGTKTGVWNRFDGSGGYDLFADTCFSIRRRQRDHLCRHRQCCRTKTSHTTERAREYQSSLTAKPEFSNTEDAIHLYLRLRLIE